MPVRACATRPPGRIVENRVAAVAGVLERPRGHGTRALIAAACARASPRRLLPFPWAAKPQDSDRRCVRAWGVPTTVPPPASLTLAARAKHRAPLL
jgi:hypothetical protein